MVTDGRSVEARRLRPEVEELARHDAQIAELQEQFADRAIELATRRRELRGFEQRLRAIVGTRQAELGLFEAEIAALLAAGDPSPEAEQAAEASAEPARRSAEDAGDDPEALRQSIPDMLREIPDQLRWVFRQVAKAVHPDYAVDDGDRAAREFAMAEADAAYEFGGGAAIRSVLEVRESRPEAVPGDDVGARIVRAIRRIAGAEWRLEELAAEIADLDEGSLAWLHVKAQEAQAQRRDLLQEMGAELDRLISEARLRLQELSGVMEQCIG